MDDDDDDDNDSKSKGDVIEVEVHMYLQHDVIIVLIDCFEIILSDHQNSWILGRC